jgi:hypothetical protein
MKLKVHYVESLQAYRKLTDVIKVKVLGDYTLLLEFDDGAAGRVDISSIVPF